MSGVWDQFTSYGQERSLTKGSILFRQGDIGSGFYYLDEGNAIVYLLSDQGHERIIDYIGPKELMGEQGVKAKPLFTTARLMSASKVFYFSNQVFQSLLRQHPEAAGIFTKSLIVKERLLAHTVSILDSPPEFQMAYFLHRIYIKHNNPEIKINQTTIAHYIGISRITVYKILHEWKIKGIVDVSNRSIHILDLGKFQTLLLNPK